MTHAAPALLALATLGLLAAADGGYFASTWGWSALALLWVCVIALLLDRSLPLAALDRAALVALFALVAWIGVSATWSDSVSQSVLEVERAVVYLAGMLAVLLVTRRRAVPHLLAGVLGAIVVACAYGLATRLFPERLGAFDPIAVYRLSEPVGYWNALGIFSAMGALVALGFSARARSSVLRALSAASLPVLVPTLYFTFGRGPWIALGVALAAAIALDPRRLQLVTTLFVVGPAPAAAVWLGSQSEGLTRQQSSLAGASRDGQRLAVTILVLAALSALAVLALSHVEKRIRAERPLRLLYGATLLVLAVALLAGVFARYGGPVTLTRNAYRAFVAPPVGITSPGTNLNTRLLSFSGNGRPDLWRVAWDHYEAHRGLGSGAGTYQQAWLRHRPRPDQALDAHSLYLEALTELGPAGVALLAAAFGIPLGAGLRARRHPLAPTAFAAYLAYVVHAGVDWDWEMTGVTLTALFCGGALLVLARENEQASVLSRKARLGALAFTLALVAFAFVTVVGNSALAAGEGAAAAGDREKVEAETHKAMRWAPWSAEPWRILGEAQLADGDLARARKSVREAIAKDPRNWALWYDLALATGGREARRALREAARLNPLSSEIARYREEREVVRKLARAAGGGSGRGSR